MKAGWDTYVNDRDHSKAATHLLTRIEAYYGDRAIAATKVLDLVAMSPEPVSVVAIAGRVDSCRQVLDDLVDDHYLIDTPSGLKWRPVLRRFWVVRQRLL